MRVPHLVALCVLFSTLNCIAQQRDVWTRFEDKRTGRFGYKDAQGVIRVRPRFSEPFVPASRFEHLAAVTGEDQHNQYLLKSGRLVARDSVYMFDYYFDCESEGYIRYQTHARVGFLNRDGKAFIPAVYNYASPFYNGVAVALKGARRTCGSSPDTTNCEHMLWEGGTRMLINNRNEVVVPDLGSADVSTLDWYSLKTNPAPTDTLYRVQLHGSGGTVYSFVDYRREFNDWFYHDFLPAVRMGEAPALAARCLTRVTLSRRKAKTNKFYSPAAFGTAYSRLLQEHLRFLRPGLPQVHVFADNLGGLDADVPAFRPFFTLCGSLDTERYPVFSVVVNYGKLATPGHYQEHFQFIRTPDGYRLFEVWL